jgi:predicted ATPase
MSRSVSPKIQSLKVANYRALRDVAFKDLTPFTVLLGANGSGKSTVFDVFAFLHEAFTDGLRKAWDRRNRMAGIRSIGESGPVAFELKYSAPLDEQFRVVTYTLKIDEERGAPVIVEERLTVFPTWRMEHGGSLGDLWSEGYLEAADPEGVK